MRLIPAAAEAIPEESVLVDVVGVGADVGGAVVHPQQVAPLSPKNGLHPGRGDDAICKINPLLEKLDIKLASLTKRI